MTWVDLGWFGLIWADLGWFGLIWTDLGWFMLISAYLGWFGLIWAALGCFGLLWADLGWSGLTWTDLGWFRSWFRMWSWDQSQHSEFHVTKRYGPFGSHNWSKRNFPWFTFSRRCQGYLRFNSKSSHHGDMDVQSQENQIILLNHVKIRRARLPRRSSTAVTMHSSQL